MINEIIYTNAQGASFTAHKRVTERPAFHLQSVDGQGMPNVKANTVSTFGLPGAAFTGVNVGTRSFSANVYAAGSNAFTLERLGREISRATAPDDGIGTLRVFTDTGEAWRCAAKCTDVSTKEAHRRDVLLSLEFECPQPFWESDLLYSELLRDYVGGKTYPLTYPFNYSEVSQSGTVHKFINNNGDMNTPVELTFLGLTTQSITISNLTTGASMGINVGSGYSLSAITINTDPDSFGAWYRLAGSDEFVDAGAYISLTDDITNFYLAPGDNEITFYSNSGGYDVTGSKINYRERVSVCL